MPGCGPSDSASAAFRSGNCSSHEFETRDAYRKFLTINLRGWYFGCEQTLAKAKVVLLIRAPFAIRVAFLQPIYHGMFSSIQSNIIEPYLVMRQSLAPLKLSRWQLTKIMARTAFEGLPSGSFVLLAALALLLVVVRFESKKSTVSKEIPGLPLVKRNHTHFLDIVREGRELVREPRHHVNPSSLPRRHLCLANKI